MPPVIHTGWKYTHAEHGEVVATTILASFETFDTTTTDNDLPEPTVVFYDDWDGYGPNAFNLGAKHRAPVSEFADHTTGGEEMEFTHE